MVKSDAGVFGTRILGYVLGVLGSLFGLIMIIGGKIMAGIIILVLSLVLGRFLIWKSHRREGHIVYNGGRI